MKIMNLGDNLHRVVKLAIDSGEVVSLAEAEQLFAGYQLMIEVGPDVATSPSLQAALLTVVNTGRRCFLGGVQVTGHLESDLCVPWPGCRTLDEVVTDLQGNVVKNVTPEIPRIVIGDAGPNRDVGEFAVRVTFNGWAGGVAPLQDGIRLSEQQEFTPAGVLAGAVAVSEAFQFLRGNPLAGRRELGLSLWQLEEEISWLTAEPGPPLEYLPTKVWLIGLGHLGQAYLWTLGLLPYPTPGEVQLVLQDFDTLVPANDSTSLLTNTTVLGKKKTRAMAHWCEARGFRTAIQERRFASNFVIDDEEPRVALCGVDNQVARAALEDVGFDRIIEAGLGRGTHEYLAFQIHTFPAQRSARMHWGGGEETPNDDELISQPAYQGLAADGLDQCGLTMLANRTVGASFVGATAATIVIAELLRMVVDEHRYEVIDGSLRALTKRQAIASNIVLDPVNLGYSSVMSAR